MQHFHNPNYLHMFYTARLIGMTCVKGHLNTLKHIY